MDSARQVPPIPIALEPTNAVFNFDSQPCQCAVGLLSGVAQVLSRRFFLGRDAVGMKFGNALIALIGQTQQAATQSHFAALEQAQVVGAPFACGNGDKLPSIQVNYNLRLQRMPLVLAKAISGKNYSPRFCRAVVGTLFFLVAQWSLQSHPQPQPPKLGSAC